MATYDFILCRRCLFFISATKGGGICVGWAGYDVGLGGGAVGHRVPGAMCSDADLILA